MFSLFLIWVFVGMIQIETLGITPQMLALVGEIDEFKGAWRALG